MTLANSTKKRRRLWQIAVRLQCSLPGEVALNFWCNYVGTQESFGCNNYFFHEVGTQESVVNVNRYPSYVGQLMWANMMPHHMPPNMAQGGSVLPFSPSLCPTGTSFNQCINNFPSSQSNMPSQVWRGQSSITDTQVWKGGQTSFLEDQCQGWGGAQPSFMESQGRGWGGGQSSFMEMMIARDDISKE